MSHAFDLAGFIRRIRPDLARRFPLRDPAQRPLLLLWLLEHERARYRALDDSAALREELCGPGQGPSGCLNLLQYFVYRQRKDVRKVFPLPARLADFSQWYYTHGVDEHGLWPLLSAAEQRRMLMLPRADGAQARGRVVDWLLPEALRQPVLERPFGVNVTGPLQARSAAGNHARQMLAALQHAGIPCAGLDVRATSQAGCSGAYQFNLYCLSPLETGRFYAEHGAVQGRDRYNIGYWDWAQARWPVSDHGLFELVDEVWVTSAAAQDLLRRVAPVTVRYMPAASTHEQQTATKRGRTQGAARHARRLREILALLASSGTCAEYPRHLQQGGDGS